MQRGLSEASDEHVSIKRQMLDLADRVYLMADHSKFGLRSLVFYASVGETDVLITDADTPASVLTSVGKQGVEVQLAK